MKKEALVNKEQRALVEEIVELQFLFVRWMERNTNRKYRTHRDVDRVLMGSGLSTTYKRATERLMENVKALCRNNYLLKSAILLDEKVKESSIANLKFGLTYQTELEKELNRLLFVSKFYMINHMVDIKYIVSNLGLTEEEIIVACEQEKLLNTIRSGRSWIVYIPEVKKYWDIIDTKHILHEGIVDV